MRGGGAGWSEFPEQFLEGRKGRRGSRLAREVRECKAEGLGWSPT